MLTRVCALAALAVSESTPSVLNSKVIDGSIFPVSGNLNRAQACRDGRTVKLLLRPDMVVVVPDVAVACRVEAEGLCPGVSPPESC